MRQLGRSGLLVSEFSFGTMTFGGEGFYASIGSSQVDDARRLIGLCLDAGINMFDTADIYSLGLAEEILGQALGKDRRKQVLVATKAFLPIGPGPNDLGCSRHHLMSACEDSLRRLGTDWIDLYYVHNIDGLTPQEETLSALDDLVRCGKVRYIGCSNHTGWQLMKALGISERDRLERYVAQQISYSLLGREVEWELLPLGVDQGVGAIIWGPLSNGALSGKLRRNALPPPGSRLAAWGDSPMAKTLDQERLFCIVDVLDEIVAARPGVTVAQVALNYVRQRCGVTSVLLGARTEEQLKENLAAANWRLTDEEVRRLDEASARPLPYPYGLQRTLNPERNPLLALFPQGPAQTFDPETKGS